APYAIASRTRPPRQQSLRLRSRRTRQSCDSWCGLALAPFEEHDLIDATTFEILRQAVGPQHVDRIDDIGLAEADMDARVAAALEAVGRVNDPQPAPIAGVDGDFGAVGIALVA